MASWRKPDFEGGIRKHFHYITYKVYFESIKISNKITHDLDRIVLSACMMENKQV
jgi:hypothetical protein